MEDHYDHAPREFLVASASIGFFIVTINTLFAGCFRAGSGWDQTKNHVIRSFRQLTATCVWREDLLAAERKVGDKRAELLFQECKFWLPAIIALSCLFEAVRAYNIFAESPRWMGWVSDMFWMCTLLALTLCHLMPTSFARKYIHHVYSLYLFTCTTTAFHTSDVSHHYIEKTVLIPRLISSLWCSGPMTGIVCNLIYLAGQLMRYRQLRLDEGWEEWDWNWWEDRIMLMSIVVEFVTCIVFLPLRQVWKLDQARNLLAVNLKQNELGAARALLETVCDSVVELNSEYELCESSPKLSAMLLQSEPIPAGVCFTRYLASEQAGDYFIANITRAIPFAKGLAHAFHIDMRDYVGTIIKARLFHVPYGEHSDSLHHLIGICEQQQEESALSRTQVQDNREMQTDWQEHETDYLGTHRALAPDVIGMPPLMSEVLARGEAAISHSSSLSATASDSSNESGDASSSSSPGSLCEAGKLTVVAQISSSTMTISRCSPQFSKIFFVYGGDSLGSLFTGGERYFNRESLRETCKRALGGLSVAPLRVSLSPKNTQRFGVIVKATLAITAITQDRDSPAIADLEFSNLEWKTEKQKKIKKTEKEKKIKKGNNTKPSLGTSRETTATTSQPLNDLSATIGRERFELYYL